MRPIEALNRIHQGMNRRDLWQIVLRTGGTIEKHKTCGAALKRLRVDAGYTQATLANRIGWDEKTIGNWEQGHSRPTVEGYEALCDVLPFLLEVPTPEGLRKRTRQARDAASEATPDYASLGAAYGLAVGAARLRHAAVAAAKEALLQAEERAKEADAAVRAAHDALLNGSSPKE